MHERTDFATRLPPDFFTEPVIACDRVMIVELVRPIVIRFLTDASRGLDHVEYQLLRRLTALAFDQRQLGAEGAHLIELFAAEGVGRDDLDLVAFRRADERQ